MKISRIKILKNAHLHLSILLFLVVLFTAMSRTDLSIDKMALSNLGICKDGWIWNGGLAGIAVVLFFKIRSSIKSFIESPVLQWINIFLFATLFLTAVVNMNYFFHNITAACYFLSTSVLIFLFGVKIHKTNFRIAQVSMVLGILSALVPLIFYKMVNSLAIPEMIHVAILFNWLLILEYDLKVIALLKKIGL